MTIAEMRQALGLDPEVSDAEVVVAYVAWAGLGAPLAAGAGEPVYDPIAAAVDAQFESIWSREAIFASPDGQPLSAPIRVIYSQPDEETAFGEAGVIQGTNIFLMRLREVLAPVKNATLQIGPQVFRLKGEAMLDVEGVTWRMGAVPA